jgi:hypothetical protein
MLIYKATNIINGKCYIGQTVQPLNSRKSGHYYSSKVNRDNMIFHKAIRKYGEENFKWEILCECISQDEMNKLEQFHMLENNSLNPNGYNLMLNPHHSKRKSNGIKNPGISLNEMYVAISKCNTIKEISNYLDRSESNIRLYLRKYKFNDYMKSKKNMTMCQ